MPNLKNAGKSSFASNLKLEQKENNITSSESIPMKKSPVSKSKHNSEKEKSKVESTKKVFV